MDERVVGPYELTGLLGRGAMGAVYRARHRGLGVERALKLLPPGSDAARRERFVREGQHLARVEDAHVVRVRVATSVGRIYAVPLDPALPPREPLVPPAADRAPGGEVLPSAHGTGVVRGLARAPDADRLWSVAGGTWPGARQLRAWDLRTGALRYEVAGLDLDPARLVVSPSGRLLAVSSEEGPVQVWATD